MDGVTAATMRSEGAAPRRAARYGALSLVLVTLLGQGKAGAGGDLRVPQWAVGKLGRRWRGWRGIRVPPRASSYGDRGHWPQLGALEPGLGILHGSPPRSPTASLRESGEGAGGRGCRTRGSGLHLDFYIGLHIPDWMQLRDAERTPVSRGPFPSFRATRDFPPHVRPSGGVESIGPLWFPATLPLGSHFGPLLRGWGGRGTWEPRLCRFLETCANRLTQPGQSARCLLRSLSLIITLM